MQKKIWTIWHSSLKLTDFNNMLNKYKITHLLDIRSTPYSQFNPQFNKWPLWKELSAIWVEYMRFGGEFGARYDDIHLQDDTWRVDFEKVIKSEKFIVGVSRMEKWLSLWFRICLMCSEADPLECHRFSMVSSYLYNTWEYEICHIIKKKEVVVDLSHSILEDVMLDEFNLKVWLFHAREELLKIAYKKKNDQIWYKKST